MKHGPTVDAAYLYRDSISLSRRTSVAQTDCRGHMTVYYTYGTSSHTVAELVADQLGLSFVEHDSSYRGIYYHAHAPPSNA